MRRALGAFYKLNILGRYLAVSVDDGENKVCLLHRSARARDAHALDLIVGLTYAGCVGQTKQYAAETQLFLDRVARRAGDIGDYGAVIAQNGVQK